MADLIDRQSLIDHLNECLAEEYDRPYITDAVTIAIKCFVEQMPTVEQKRGEWERHPDFLHIRSANVHRCSLCKERPLYRMGYEVLSAFCPNCGADMRGKDI